MPGPAPRRPPNVQAVRRAWPAAFEHATRAGYSVDNAAGVVYCPGCEQRVLDSIASHARLHGLLGPGVNAERPAWWPR